MSLGQVDLATLSRTEQEKLQQLLTPKMTKYIVHKPYPKQAAFMLINSKEAFYGGAAGGGKSDALLMCALQYVDIPGYSAIVFRKTFADLVKPGALIDRAHGWLAPWLNTKEVRWVEKERKFVFPSGAILQFGYLENPKDRFNYQGGEYQFIGFDEITHIAEGSYKYMFSRLRKLKGVEIPLRVRSASNPPDDGDDAEWVYNRFVNPATKKEHVIYIPAGLSDNPYLDTESYVESLNELDPVTRARLRDGIWTITRKGNMFKESWFEEVEQAPAGRRRLRFWDCAATEVDPKKAKSRSKDPDYTASVLLSEKDGIYYLEHIVHTRASSLGVEKLQERTALIDGIVTRVREEEEGGSSGKYAIDKKRRGIFAGYAYEGVRSSGDKITRAMPVSAAAERGIIKIVKGCPNLEAFFTELETFPAGAHDDLVDALSGAFNCLSQLPVTGIPLIIGEQAQSNWAFDEMEGHSTLAWEHMAIGSYWTV